MRTHFTQIFWGLAIVAINFSINNFDLLPDGLGYVLMALGCGGAIPLSARFATARLLCWLLAVLWLVGFLVPPELGKIYGVPLAVASCSMIWQLLGGVRDFAQDSGRPDLAQRASTLRTAFVAVMVVATLLASFVDPEARALAGPFVVVTVVAGLVVLVMILHLIRRVRSELLPETGYEREPAPE
jgi:hypothetical protein